MKLHKEFIPLVKSKMAEDIESVNERASSCVNLTKMVSVRFASWLMMYDINFIDNVSRGNIYDVEGVNLKGHFTLEELFEEFLKQYNK